MRFSGYLVAAAILAGGLTVLAPAIGALPTGCIPTNDVVIPTAGFITNWTPDCMIIKNGDTITFTSIDLIPHGPRREGCFDAPGTTNVAGGPILTTFSVDLTHDLLIVEGVKGSGEETFEACSLSELEVKDSTVEFGFDCIIHKALMPGRIVIEL